MNNIPPVPETDAGDPEEFKPLTAEQAQALRERHPPVSPWRVVQVQAVVGLLVAMAAWGITGRQNVGWSAGYGALAVVLPAAVFARGLARGASLPGAGAALLRFFLWEMVKLALSVAMLVAAPRLVSGLHWLALLAGFVLTIKVYWVAMLIVPGQTKHVAKFKDE